MEKNELEIGKTYEVKGGILHFTGVLVKIFKDEIVLVESTGTGRQYKVNFNSLYKL